MASLQIDKLLNACIRQGASDIHITTGQPPTFRLHGRMRRLETKVLESDDTVSLMKSIAPERCQRELQEAGTSDFGFAFGDAGRFRVSIFKQRGDIGMVLRLIPNELLGPDVLGCPERVKELVKQPRGLFLVTGPTGCGKSTTLAGLIDYINQRMDHHIITIEDPIEFYHYHKKSVINQREVHVDVPSFAEAIKRAQVVLFPQPVTLCLARCTPTARKRRSTESLTRFRETSRTRSALNCRPACWASSPSNCFPRKVVVGSLRTN